MNITYQRAGLTELDLLVSTRIQVLQAANQLDAAVDMSIVERESRLYYQEALRQGKHVAYLVWDEKIVIGTGGVSFYQVMPTCHNPTGYKAYIMNMYTEPKYRRRGIATKVLDRLVQEVREEGIDFISLEATEAGRALYEKYGFVQMEGEMQLPILYSSISTGIQNAGSPEPMSSLPPIGNRKR